MISNAIMLYYPYIEMEKALERVGYEIKEVLIDASWYDQRHFPDDDYDKRRTYMVYKDGVCITDGPKFERMYGYARVEAVFSTKLRFELLELFK